MSAHNLQLLGGAIAATSIIALVLSLKSSTEAAAKRKGLIATAMLLATGAITFAVPTVTISTAYAHGAYEIGDMTVSELSAHTAASPVDQSSSLPDEPASAIVYIYRYTCPDCEDMHAYIQDWLESQSSQSGLPAYNVSSRSERGVELKDALGINEVPSIAVFRADGSWDWEVVYRMDDETAVPDTAAFEKLEEEIENVSGL